MNSLSKKLSVLLLSVIAAACLILSALFTFNLTASAETVTLEEESHFIISGTTVVGLSDDGKAAIGDNYFSIKLPEDQNLTTIASNAFKNYDKLISVEIPEGIIDIGFMAFSDCTSLRSVKLPESLGTISVGAFKNCSSLITITIPAGVYDINNTAFEGCTRLVEVRNESTEAGLTINVPGALNIYKPADGSAKLEAADANGFVFYADEDTVYLIDYEGTAAKITLPEDYNGKPYAIYKEAFKNDSSLTGITFPDGAITAIGESAFWGCSSLTGITVPENVNTIADNLFYGCTSLKTVDFKNNFSILGASAFANCTSLESIDLPSALYQIESSAFKGCTSLKTVTFKKQLNGQYNLHLIRASAFEDCRSLEYIELPDSVTNIQQNAFSNCVHLSTVYLPANAEFGSNVFDPDDSQLSFDNDYARVLLIAPDAAAYNTYLNGTLSDYTENLTYVVDLTLVYDGAEHTDYRLFKCEYSDYKYVLQDDGKIWAQNGGMPAQSGYKTSIWYKEQNYSSKVDGNELNNMLNGAEITLYAQTVEKPSLIPNETLIYDSDVQEITWAEAAGWTEEMGEACEISITGYTPYYGTATIPEKIKDAGTYTLSVTLKADDYGVWDSECTVTVVVKRAKRDLALLNWITVDGASLASTDSDKPLIYLYKNDMGVTVPYLDENPSLTSAGQPKPVINSYLFYNGSEQTIVLADDENYDGDLKVTYKNNTYKAAGVYTVEAEIPADNNYEFDGTSGTDATYRGINVSGLYPGSQKYTITKTWYIVAATTNGLIIGGSPYNVPLVWTYKGGAVSAPSVNFGNANDLVTFTLNRKDINSNKDYVLVCGNMPYSKFENVINHSMPVGDYRLVIRIDDYTAPSGTFYAGSEQTFDFTVMNAVYENTEGKEIEEILHIGSLNEIRYSTSVRFAEISGWDLLEEADKLHDIPTGDNFWAGSDYADYYRGFEIRYSVVSDKGSSGGYFTLEDYQGKTDKNPRIVPNTVGVYTVNYIISAPGYVSHSDEYTLVIYDVLNIENIQHNIDALNIAYNREARKPNLDTDVYRAVYLDDATNSEVQSAMSELGIDETYSYINAGEYPVALVVRDSLYVESAGCYLYRWQGQSSTASYVEVKLNINKAENNTFTPLSVTEWRWGDPAESIKVSWSTDWVKDAKQFTFELVPEDKTKEPYALADFYKADSGFYTLKATCPEGENYKEGKAEIIVFVKPAEISWLIAPQIDSWKYGDFEKMFKVPTPVLNTAVGALQAEITDSAKYFREGDANGYASLSSFLDGNRQLPVGKYMLVYNYNAQGNYANFRDVISFQVLKADNYWDIAPVVNGWTYGDKAIDYLTYKPDCKPHYTDGTEVTVQFRIVDENGVEKTNWRNRLADLGLDEYGKLSVGFYEIRAELPGSANYEAMEFTMRFKVTKSQNSWDEIPNVISWNEGRINSIDDVLTVMPANGTVLITITDSNGNVIVEDELPEDINVNKLKSLSAGAYTLKAYVAGSDRFDELVAYVDFAVFEDTVSQTALIALTIVFAVIAIALAVVGVVLLVRRDKQIEEEFRKMIKAELYRR